MKTFVLILLIFISITISFSYGFFAGVFEYFPYSELNNIKQNVLDENIYDSAENNIIPNFNLLIDIKNTNDIQNKKNSLIQFIWKSEFPSIQPTQIDRIITDDNYQDLKNLKNIERLSIEMKHDVNSIVYHFIPEKSNNKLIIYHQGHGGDFLIGKNTIQFFLENNYSILAFSMPLQGMNSRPVIDSDQFGPINFFSHNQFVLLDSPDFSSIQYFMHPIAVSLNYVDENYNYDSYDMIGISGGGWATILYSAIDNRISQSYSVAGSFPFYLRDEIKHLGDYEQINSELYKNANYLELYIMSSYGKDRKLVQIFNKFDPCCFSGDKFYLYEDDIKNGVSNIGNGFFAIYVDEETRLHEISDLSLDKIMVELKN